MTGAGSGGKTGSCVVCNCNSDCHVFQLDAALLAGGQCLHTTLYRVLNSRLDSWAPHGSVVCRDCFHLLVRIDCLETLVQDMCGDVVKRYAFACEQAGFQYRPKKTTATSSLQNATSQCERVVSGVQNLSMAGAAGSAVQCEQHMPESVGASSSDIVNMHNDAAPAVGVSSLLSGSAGGAIMDCFQSPPTGNASSWPVTSTHSPTTTPVSSNSNNNQLLFLPDYLCLPEAHRANTSSLLATLPSEPFCLDYSANPPGPINLTADILSSCDASVTSSPADASAVASQSHRRSHDAHKQQQHDEELTAAESLIAVAVSQLQQQQQQVGNDRDLLRSSTPQPDSHELPQSLALVATHSAAPVFTTASQTAVEHRAPVVLQASNISSCKHALPPCLNTPSLHAASILPVVGRPPNSALSINNEPNSLTTVASIPSELTATYDGSNLSSAATNNSMNTSANDVSNQFSTVRSATGQLASTQSVVKSLLTLHGVANSLTNVQSGTNVPPTNIHLDKTFQTFVSGASNSSIQEMCDSLKATEGTPESIVAAQQCSNGRELRHAFESHQAASNSIVSIQGGPISAGLEAEASNSLGKSEHETTSRLTNEDETTESRETDGTKLNCCVARSSQNYTDKHSSVSLVSTRDTSRSSPNGQGSHVGCVRGRLCRERCVLDQSWPTLQQGQRLRLGLYCSRHGGQGGEALVCFYCDHEGCSQTLALRSHVMQHHQPRLLLDRVIIGDRPTLFNMGMQLSNVSAPRSTGRPFVCIFCDGVYKTIRSLRCHFRESHTPHMRHKCINCGEMFRRQMDLARHRVYRCRHRKLAPNSNHQPPIDQPMHTRLEAHTVHEDKTGQVDQQTRPHLPQETQHSQTLYQQQMPAQCEEYF